MSNLDVTVIRIDPVKRQCAAVVIRGRNLASDVRRLTRAKQLGHRHLLDIEERRLMGTRMGKSGKQETYDAGPTQLFVAADAMADDGQPGWRLKGGETTVGLSVLFGKGLNGMVSTPVDLRWLAERLVWVDAETADAEKDPGE